MRNIKRICIAGLSLLCAAALSFVSYAVVLGDIDSDSKVTASDARLALRNAVGLEYLSSSQQTVADVDFDGKVSASDARLILRTSVGLETIKTLNNDSTVIDYNTQPTAVYDGMTVTKLPYTHNGLTVESVTFDKKSGKAECVLANNSGMPIRDISCMECVCRDASGTILQTKTMYTEYLNNGEKCRYTFYYDKNTAKIQFGKAEIKPDAYAPDNATSTYAGIKSFPNPFDIEGIRIHLLSENDRKVTCSLTNVSDKAISSCYVYIKFYDAQGYVIGSTTLAANCLNPNDKGQDDFRIPENAVKMTVKSATAYAASKAYAVNPTSACGGYQITSAPFSMNGITIRSVSVNGGTAKFLCENKTGKPISNYTTVYYRYFDASGYVMGQTSIRIETLNSGEICSAVFELPKNAAKIMISDISVSEGNHLSNPSATQTVSGIRTNVFPYTADGVRVTSMQFDSATREYTLNVTNVSGKNASKSSYVLLKVYDANGYVINSGRLYFDTDVNAGASVRLSLPLEDDAVSCYVVGGEII